MKRKDRMNTDIKPMQSFLCNSEKGLVNIETRYVSFYSKMCNQSRIMLYTVSTQLASAWNGSSFPQPRLLRLVHSLLVIGTFTLVGLCVHFFQQCLVLKLENMSRPRNTETHEDDGRRHCQNGRSTGGFSGCGLRDPLRRHGQLPVPTRPGISGSRQCYRSDHYINWTAFISACYPTGWLGLMFKASVFNNHAGRLRKRCASQRKIIPAWHTDDGFSGRGITLAVDDNTLALWIIGFVAVGSHCVVVEEWTWRWPYLP